MVLSWETPVGFLRVVLPMVDRMRESEDVLAHHAYYSQHFHAAQDLLDGLCNSIRMFSTVSLPQLLGSHEPLPVDLHGDLAWLVNVGYHLDRVLEKNGLNWPPPTQRDPPAIVRDLSEMYTQVALRNEYFNTVTAESLLKVVQPVGEKACYLMGSVDIVLGELKQTADKPGGARLTRRLTAALSGVALGIGLLQGPATITNFPDDWNEFSHSVEHVVKIAANSAVDSAIEVGHMLHPY
jgi:hypothetical protein